MNNKTEYDFLRELTFVNDEKISEISSKYPMPDKAALKRINALCEEKLTMKENDINAIEATGADNVEVIRNIPWYRRPAFTAAACFVVLAGITGGVMAMFSGKNNEEIPDTPPVTIVETTTTDSAEITTEVLTDVTTTETFTETELTKTTAATKKSDEATTEKITTTKKTTKTTTKDETEKTTTKDTTKTTMTSTITATTTTSATDIIQPDYRTFLEYDNSPMKVGETRTVRFYHPSLDKMTSVNIYEVSDKISYTYESGSDTLTITALAPGNGRMMYIMGEGCAFGAYLNLEIIEAPVQPAEFTEDMAKDYLEMIHYFSKLEACVDYEINYDMNNSFTTEGGKEYVKINESNFNSVAELESYINSWMTEKCMADNFGGFYYYFEERFVDRENGLYAEYCPRTDSFSWFDSEYSVEKVTNDKYIIHSFSRVQGIECPLEVDIIKAADGSWKIDDVRESWEI